MTSFLRLYFNRLLPQLIALGIIVAAVSLVFPGFLNLQIQNGRLYGSLIDILNRGAPVVLLAIGMTVVIATKGIDLSPTSYDFTVTPPVLPDKDGFYPIPVPGKTEVIKG